MTFEVFWEKTKTKLERKGFQAEEVEKMKKSFVTVFNKMARVEVGKDKKDEPIKAISYNDCLGYAHRRYRKKAFMMDLKHSIKMFYHMDKNKTGTITVGQYWKWKKRVLLRTGIMKENDIGHEEKVYKEMFNNIATKGVSTWG